MNRMMAAAALGMMAIAQPALAVPTVKTPVPTIIYTPGSYAVPNWTSAKIFETFQTASLGAYHPKGIESTTGTVEIDQGTAFGAAAYGNKYLSVTSAGTFAVNFASAMQYFSFSVHSLNSTDKLTLNFANGTSLALLGTQMVGATSASLASLLDTSGRVNIDMAGQSAIMSAVFSSTSECTPFMIDNLAAATPEVGTWGMMIVGFGLVGFAIRRAHRRSEERFDARIRRIAAGEA